MSDKIQSFRHFLHVLLSPRQSSREALADWQSRQFEHFARKTLSRSPFYKGLVGHPLSDYPMIDKKFWVSHFDEINTRELSDATLFEVALSSERSRDFKTRTFNDIAVGLSSGTSGQRALFVTDRHERARYAGTLIAKCLGKEAFKKQRVALLLRANNKLYESIGSSRIKFQYFDLQRGWTEILKELHKYQPTILVGPPQVLSLIAHAQRTRRILLAPKKIICSAEVLESKEQSEIESVFQVPVDQIYQATEGFLGVSCKYGTIHLNEDSIIAEKHWLDRASRRFVPVITDFARTTQPLIRYRLNDVLIERKEQCPCGSIFTGVEKIEGREDDILFLPGKESSAKMLPVMPDFVRDAMALSTDKITDYRVVQQSYNLLEIAVEGPDLNQAKERAVLNLQKLFTDLNLKMPELIFAERITCDVHTKLRRVRRLFPLTEAME